MNEIGERWNAHRSPVVPGATRAWHSPRVMTGKHNTHAVTPRFALGSKKDDGQHLEWQHFHEIRLNSRIPLYVIFARSSRKHPEKRKS
jgi:hypothetical protein